jgi:hypothetical protein
MINFANGLPTDVRLLYPVTSTNPLTSITESQIDIFSPGASGQWTCPNSFLLTSELYSF